MADLTRYPLCWPAGWKRTPDYQRTWGKFGTRDNSRSYPTRKELTVAQATERVLGELGRMGIRSDDIVISTNIILRLDGLPRSGQADPKDPGVAVYWQTKKHGQRCMAVDQYAKVADNLAAIAATLDAMRAIERHGGASILDRAFTGFTALPAPTVMGRHWSDVLEVNPDCSLATVELNYKRLRSEHHPDRGGDPVRFDAVQKAWEQAQKEIGR